jgi:hypothetical protein
MLPYKNVKILAANLERKNFTKHGMHLNTAGKEQAALGLAKVVRSFRKSNMTPPISLCWKGDTLVNETAPDPNGNTSTSMGNTPIRDKNESVSQLDLGHQDSPTTSYDIPECQSPDYKNDDAQKSGNEAVSRTGEDPQDPQEEETTRKSNRVKKPPTKRTRIFYAKQSV